MASFDENGKYIKTNWKAGDKITATKLNKIEESIEAVNDNDISRHVEADARLDALEAKDVAHDKEFTNVKNLIADNKAAAELGDYDINSRMTFLENELNEGIEEVHNVAETVDGKIATAEANMTAQVDQGKADMEAMVAEVEADLEGLHAKDDELAEQLADITYFLTPEMFGAKGDGVNDDTEALKRLFNSPNVTIIFPTQKIYKITQEIYIDNSNIQINGNNSTITSSNTHIFDISSNSSNIEINNIKFKNDYIGELSNACVRTSSLNNSCGIGDSTKNIIINNCEFDGGVFGVVLNSATNVKIKDCCFKNHEYVDSDGAGGYAVLIQSSYNVEVIGCENIAGAYNRHFCYISVDGQKTANKENKNIKVLNNYIDFTNVNGISGAECGIVIRESQDVQISNNYFLNTIGGIYTNIAFEDGLTKNIRIKDNHFKNIREIQGKFTRASIGIVGDYPVHDCIIENNYFENSTTKDVIVLGNCFNVTSKNNKINTNSSETRVYTINNATNFLIDGDRVEGVRLSNIRYEGNPSTGRITNFYKDDYFATTEFASGVIVKTTRDILRPCKIQYDDLNNSVSITRNFESIIKSVNIEEYGFTITFNFIDVNTFNFNVLQTFGHPSALILRSLDSTTNSVSFNVVNLDGNKGSKQWNIYI